MKKLTIIAIITVVVIGSLILFKERVAEFVTKEVESTGAGAANRQDDLEIINDTKHIVSSEYTKELHKEPIVAKPSEVLPGGKGFLSIQVPDKTGYYEIRYPYPRPADKPSHISVSQIMSAVEGKQMNMEGEVLASKGMVDDISISYEKIPE